ncbi:OLC1v1033580C1 [Oldenlandia corymbosa var. corymbosa]|uniref:Solute carrier family 40 member n=1 Tax=Oldenlandia corymbosa var. corymbosa TaxID=529605 RepID=A0AAV1CP89_OLDCO|nr:OLC1v1033580C1 [Oldenlandia corymbosa var. corymbosa]
MLNEPLINSDDEPQQHPLSFPPYLLAYLYVGHFLARWGARMWEFSVGLYMINVWPDSLLLAAAYGVVESGSTALFGPFVGQWVDNFTYVKVVRLWLLSQNLSFVIAGVTVIALLVFEDMLSLKSPAFISLVLLINLSGAVAVLSTLAGTILVEREWVVVIAEGQPPGTLTKMNSMIRRIDLSCKLFGPVLTGFVISFVSLTASALILALWNLISVCFQYWLLMSVYNGIPALSESSHKRLQRRRDNEAPNDVPNDHQRSGGNQNSYFSAWRVYLEQDVVLAGMALALLYFTVLSFGTLMTAALEWEGVPAYIIGIARGISATIGIGATFLYPLLESRISTLRTGLWSIWSQWSCLLVCVASIWVQNRRGAAYMLMGEWLCHVSDFGCLIYPSSSKCKIKYQNVIGAWLEGYKTPCNLLWI